MDFKLKKTIFVLMTIVLTFIMNPYSFAACNNADGKKVTLSVTGAVYVVAGSTNEYTLTFDPADVDTSGGTFNWTLPNEWSFVGETNAATVSVVVPAEEKKTRQTKGAGGDGKSEKQQFVVCSFDKEGWSGKTDCSASQAVKVVTVKIKKLFYFRPTASDIKHANKVYKPIITKGDKLYAKFRLEITPSSSSVKYKKVLIKLFDKKKIISKKQHLFSGVFHKNVTIVSGINIDPIDVPKTIIDKHTYNFRIDVELEINGKIILFKNVWSENVKSNFKAVEIGRKISGEDNKSDNAREKVKDTILNRWNFPVIINGHGFTQSVLRKNNTTIYKMATSGIFHGTAMLDNTLQHARVLGAMILKKPNSASGTGEIYFYKKGSTRGKIYDLCQDASVTNVNLLQKTATYGNVYFSPSSDPNGWTTKTIKSAYNAVSNDSLKW